jgi:hypothetical protein
MKKTIIKTIIIIILFLGGLWYVSMRHSAVQNTNGNATSTQSGSATTSNSLALGPCSPGSTPSTPDQPYVNTKEGFQLTIPSGWFVPPATVGDPHFYNSCENSWTDGFEIHSYDFKEATQIESAMPVGMHVISGLVPGATTFGNGSTALSSDGNDGWPNVTYILFEADKKAFVFNSSYPITKYQFIQSFQLK